MKNTTTMMMTVKTAARRALVSSLLLGPAAASAFGAPPRKPARKATVDPYEFYVKLSALRFDNFFQTPEGSPAEDISGLGVQAGVSAKVHDSLPLAAYGRLDYVSYRDFGPSTGITGGLRLEGQPHAFDVYAQYQRGRPSREVGDVLGRANGGGLSGEYSYRVVPDVELSLLADYRHESYTLGPLRTNDTHHYGAAVRYRGFGYKFSPEVGFRRGRRSVEDPNEDLTERETFVRLRWVPARDAYVSLRYRHRRREYSIDLPQESNFGREDTRKQWTLAGDLEHNDWLSWNLYYSRESSDSTRAVGMFKTELLSFGVTLTF